MLAVLPSPEDEDLAKKSQNPIADMVSLPFQSNTNFNTGRFNRTQEELNIQPVVPLHISADWNMISRTIIPVINQQPDLYEQKYEWNWRHHAIVVLLARPFRRAFGALVRSLPFRPRPIPFSVREKCCSARR